MNGEIFDGVIVQHEVLWNYNRWLTKPEEKQDAFEQAAWAKAPRAEQVRRDLGEQAGNKWNAFLRGEAEFHPGLGRITRPRYDDQG